MDAYIKAFPKPIASRLTAIRHIVREEAPDAVECISYSIPAFKLNGLALYFAGFEHHTAIYPYPSTLSALGKQLSKYKSGRSTVKFSNDKPLPLPLIRKIVRYRIKEKRKKP